MKTEIKFKTIGTRAVVSKKITPEQAAEIMQKNPNITQVDTPACYFPRPKMKKHINIIDIHYVRSVLAEKVSSCVMDGDLEPPAGARCRTRSGFRAWLKRAEKEEAIWKSK